MAEQGDNKAKQGVPPAEYRWRPGESGNPKGRPKSKPITAAMRELLERNDGEAIRALAAVGLKKALSGKDFRFYKEYVDRIDGKVAESLDVTTGGDSLAVPGVKAADVADFYEWLAEREGVEEREGADE